MKRPRTLLCLAILAVAVAACRTKGLDRTALTLTALPENPRGLPEVIAPPDNPTTLARVNLGRALFYDTKLSPKDFMSCADCHRDDHAWAGNVPGSANAMGGRTRRKAPTVLNTGYAPVFVGRPRRHARERHRDRVGSARHDGSRGDRAEARGRRDLPRDVS